MGAFLPLAVAKEYPELLGLPTLHYQTVYSNEKLRRATKTIVAPGVFAKSNGNRKLLCLLGVISCAIIIAVIYAAWAWRSGR